MKYQIDIQANEGYGDEAQIARWHEKQKHWFYGYRSY